MKKAGFTVIAVWLGVMGFAPLGCNLGDGNNAPGDLWQPDDIAGDVGADSVDVRVEDEGGLESRAEDIALDQADQKAEVAEEVGGEIPCMPDCEGRVCGSDGCGGVCGSCVNEGACHEESGQCMEDTPDCNGKECGPDGFGGLCGVCEELSQCNDSGQCIPSPPECSYCVDPYPICMQINNIWSCVQCSNDSQCPEGSSCELTYYTCEAIPPEGAGWCNAGNGCMESDQILFELSCEVDNELCYDQFGWCDDAYARCRAGSECLILQSVPGGLIGGDPAMYPPGAGPGTVGLCSCQNPLELTQLMECFQVGAEPCPVSPECPGAQQCVNASVVSKVVPLPATAQSICVDLAKVLGAP